MKVRELVATLLTLPQEAEVYTEQWTSNEIAASPVNRAENQVVIGDDLDEICEEPGFAPIKPKIDGPTIFCVRLESFDEGIPYHYFECYTTLDAAKECLAAWVADEKELRDIDAATTDHIQIISKPDYFSWHNHTKGNYSEIWIQETQIWERSLYSKEQE